MHTVNPKVVTKVTKQRFILSKLTGGIMES